MMEVSFIKKKRDAEYQTRSLMMEEKLAKSQAKAKIYENENKIPILFVIHMYCTHMVYIYFW